MKKPVFLFLSLEDRSFFFGFGLKPAPSRGELVLVLVLDVVGVDFLRFFRKSMLGDLLGGEDESVIDTNVCSLRASELLERGGMAEEGVRVFCEEAGEMVGVV